MQIKIYRKNDFCMVITHQRTPLLHCYKSSFILKNHLEGNSLLSYTPPRLMVLPFTHSPQPETHIYPRLLPLIFISHQITKSYRLYVLNISIICSFLSNSTARILLQSLHHASPGQSFPCFQACPIQSFLPIAA